MSASAPWSVKGIDAKAREVAKDLARRSGMTLGEWLNQMILQGEDVGALISREAGAREASTRPVAASRPASRRAPEPDYYDDDEDDFQPRHSMAGQRDDRYAPAPRRAAPYFEAPASADLSRVAMALESLGSRIETSETRSASAVRGVSHAVESLLERLERTEAAQAEIATAPVRDGHVSGLSARLEETERRVNAQSERLEGLSGHLREDRERLAHLAEKMPTVQALETVASVESALGKLSNQAYENEVRTRETFRDVREDMVGLSHRLSQIELRDPDRAAQTLIDKVVARLSERLETAEAHTSGAIRALEQAFTTLDARLTRAEQGGDVTDPEAARSLTHLAADLSRRVEEARQDMRSALQASTQETVEQAVQTVASRIAEAEKRSAGAIEKMGHEVLRIADTLNRRMVSVETQSRDGLSRVSGDMRRMAETLDGRLGRIDNQHAQALERLGGEIARISERLNTKLSETERRAAELLGTVGEQIEQQRSGVHEELAARQRQSEERMAKMIEETRSRIDQKLAQVQTQSLLTETVIKPSLAEARTESANLPNPFGEVAAGAPIESTPFSQFEGGFGSDDTDIDEDVHAVAQATAHVAASNEQPLDITGHLLSQVTDFEGRDIASDYDPFADEPAADDVMNTPLHPRTDLHVDDDDSDPFADIDTSRKTAPRSEASLATGHRDATAWGPQLGTELPRSHMAFGDDEDGSVSVSTRDALAAARAAVRASMDSLDERKGLGSLKVGASRAKPEAKPKPKGGSTFMNAFKASSVAAALVAVGVTGWVAMRDDSVLTGPLFGLGKAQKASVKTPEVKDATVLAAAVTTSGVEDSLKVQADLKTRYDLAIQALNAGSPNAAEVLKQVANQGYAPAQYQLGAIYGGSGKYGTGKFAPKDEAQGRLWTQRAADGGMAAAMNDLAILLYNGEGGSQDAPMAAMWFRKAAEHGVKDSQYSLGLLYRDGVGVPINFTEAYKWLSIAANNGDKGAAKEAARLKSQLSEAQLQKAEDAISHFVPVTDSVASASRTDQNPS